ncbi:DUF4232 domain-containing protein [Terriglobus roseus]|nr:DUF4232 domain-containing protein [Terriglobus roseus]
MLSTVALLAPLVGCSAGSTNAARTAKRAEAQPSPAATVDCSAGDVTLSFDGRNGDYTGMSHDGALLVLRNTSSKTCRVPKRPQITLTDATGKPVAAKANVPPGMHPGPVLVPVALAPGASAQGSLRWVMGPVYDRNTCVDTAHAAITLPGGTVAADLRAHLCGQTGSPMEYEQEWLQLSTAAKEQP